MGAKSNTLTQRFEATVHAVATLEKLDEGDWAQVTDAERWPVGVTAHHIAAALEPIAHTTSTSTSAASGRRWASGWGWTPPRC
jgi:hypothetical protein